MEYPRGWYWVQSFNNSMNALDDTVESLPSKFTDGTKLSWRLCCHPEVSQQHREGLTGSSGSSARRSARLHLGRNSPRHQDI